MATLRRRSPAAAAISKSAIDKAGLTLQALPEKPREKLSLREAVSELHESITAALDRGYSYEEVVKILANQGVDITVASLKRYLAAARKESGTQLKGKRTRTPRSSKAVTANSVEALNIAAAIEKNGASAKATPAKTKSEKAAKASTESAPKSRQSAPKSSTSSTAKPVEKTPRSRTAAKAKPTSTATKTTSRATASRRKPGKGKSA